MRRLLESVGLHEGRKARDVTNVYTPKYLEDAVARAKAKYPA